MTLQATSTVRWSLSSRTPAPVIWHDIECGAYTADLPLWRRLADRGGGAVLEIGAGTGRVALELAARGHPVVALDRDPRLLDELGRRARQLARRHGRPIPVKTVEADARSFDLGHEFGLIAVPMQTIQLLGGPDGRSEFLACAARHLRPGGTLALALTEHFELYDFDSARTGGLSLPPPDVLEVSGTVYRSQPTAVRLDGQTVVLERRRERLRPDRSRLVESDRLTLDLISPEQLVQEGTGLGLRAGRWEDIPPTPDHVGSVVVMLDA